MFRYLPGDVVERIKGKLKKSSKSNNVNPGEGRIGITFDIVALSFLCELRYWYTVIYRSVFL